MSQEGRGGGGVKGACYGEPVCAEVTGERGSRDRAWEGSDKEEQSQRGVRRGLRLRTGVRRGLGLGVLEASGFRGSGHWPGRYQVFWSSRDF